MSKSLGSKSFALANLLLLSTALVTPSLARAQAAAPAPAPEAPAAAPPAADAAPASEEPVDVSIPGAAQPGEIVITGTRSRRDITRTAAQVVSVLSSADIARTGEGNIAGALGRVTGLSVVGNGFVYVRGLGDRYSLAMLNGSPLPSPEPLKRVVPLDLFPTEVIASSLVQKSYSVNFPGEFGGGVINLTTRAVPRDAFLSIGGDFGGNTVTTDQLGYTYYGSSSDWTGFDNGSRNTPPALANFLASGQRLSEGKVDSQAIAGQLVNFNNSIVQRNRHIPANWGVKISGGKSQEVGDDAVLGVIANFGFSTRWRTRDILQQVPSTADLSQLASNFERVSTDSRIVVNGLIGASLEFGENKLRWTNLYIRDTLKQARIGVGQRPASTNDFDFQQQNTAWFERQLFDSQLVGEFQLKDGLHLDARGGYANTRREAPNEFFFEYTKTNLVGDPYGQYFINRLNNGQRGNATVSYSTLDEDLWSGGLDLSWKALPTLTATIGYAYSNTQRFTERREFQFSAPTTFPSGVAMFRPDYLLQPSVINFYGINLVDTNEANPVFDASLVTHAGYAQIQADLTDTLSLNTGVRFETAKQIVTPVQVFTTPIASLAGTNLKNDYFLPAATLTWKFRDDMQLRFNASKTLARPQFRELIYQLYYDPDANRNFRGNPLLVDSQLYNAEARYEWYFAKDQKLAAAGFFKRINKPIESSVGALGENDTVTSFANAPSANLYGVELEGQKYFDLSGVSDSNFFASRRAVLIANYTWTQSRLKVGPDDTVALFASSVTKASDLFRDGSPLTGQSDHLVNIQIGLEDQDRLSQQTILFSYASKRVTSRGLAGQPDIVEEPGIQLDFVARQGLKLAGKEAELKLEVRNITGTKYKEYQQSGDNIVYFNLYKLGTTASLGLKLDF
ncbi:MAG: TonB-dependent receptor [Alphaproteobacteria bacterium PA4]|nr:MAG: TonB-dependent receptor [Alphaproteobacteria bacterium PA4]